MKRSRVWTGATLLAVVAAVTCSNRVAAVHVGAPSSSISPNWLKHAVIYEIFPDRFFDAAIQDIENPARQRGVGIGPGGTPELVPITVHRRWDGIPNDPNVVVPPPGAPDYAVARRIYGDGQWNLDFFGGNLPGITKRLDYLKSLGVNTLYLTPIFQADTNHKYDTGNFKLIDPGFGTLADFRALIRAARSRGMHVILDGVFEDTGSNSLYFNQFRTYPGVGAWQEYTNPALRSPYWRWYLQDPVYKDPFVTWNGIPTLILTNPADPGWQRFVYGEHDPAAPDNPARNSVAAYWLDLGISGWRLDSADNANFTPSWWQAFRRAVKRLDPEAAIIGEIWVNPTDDNGVNWLTNHTFDAVTNYPWQQAVLGFFRGTSNAGNETFVGTNAQGLADTLMTMARTYPPQAFYAMMNLLDSQDTMRVLTVLENAPPPGTISALRQALWTPTPSERVLGVHRLFLLTDLQFTWPGDPTIYYGDEVGLGGYDDPLNRRPFPWDPRRQNLAILNHYRKLGALRASLPALATGTLRMLYARGEVLAYERQIHGGRDIFGHPAPNATVIVALNNQGRSVTVNLPLGGAVRDGSVFRDWLGPTSMVGRVRGHALRVRLAPWQGVVLVQAPPRPVAWLTESTAGTESLTWLPVSGHRNYTVRLMGDGRVVSVRVDGTRLSLTHRLGPYPLTAVVQAAEGQVSEPVTIPAATLSPPHVHVVTRGDTVTLSWPPVPDALRYDVYAAGIHGGWYLVYRGPHRHWLGPIERPAMRFRVAAENVDDYAVGPPVP